MLQLVMGVLAAVGGVALIVAAATQLLHVVSLPPCSFGS